jgi:5-methylcytosine-specific restriction endonuclease McrA
MADWLARLRIQTIPAGECDHSREVPAYRPSRSLRHLVQIAQPTCTAPSCTRPADRCDLDHVIPYDQGGRTCFCNLHPLCRKHHQAKQTPGWHLDYTGPGPAIWTLPHGRTYITRPNTYPV